MALKWLCLPWKVLGKCLLSWGLHHQKEPRRSHKILTWSCPTHPTSLLGPSLGAVSFWTAGVGGPLQALEAAPGSLRGMRSLWTWQSEDLRWAPLVCDVGAGRGRGCVCTSLAFILKIYSRNLDTQKEMLLFSVFSPWLLLSRSPELFTWRKKPLKLQLSPSIIWCIGTEPCYSEFGLSVVWAQGHWPQLRACSVAGPTQGQRSRVHIP